MSGGSLPYQLRPNKAVERLIFLELLSIMDPVLHIGRDYRYYGFGAPQMEDFRLLHERFPRMPMTSIERDSAVVKRQKFNNPHTNVICRHRTSETFVETFRSSTASVVWLDFTDANRTSQIADFQGILRKLRKDSILKITMNAAVSTLGGTSNAAGLHAERLEIFRRGFGRCFPKGLTEEDVMTESFPRTLLEALNFCASEALANRKEWRFQPLTSCIYADGQKMVAVTGIVGTRDSVLDVINTPEYAKWFFKRTIWNDPVNISVPDLTLKERILINQLLPKFNDKISSIHKKLGCWVDTTEERSEEKLRNYIDFHRHYPLFGKVAL